MGGCEGAEDERREAARVPWKDVRGKGVVSKPPMCNWFMAVNCF